MAEIYALIRVSTQEQNEERQVVEMMKLGIPKKNIVIEKESGKTTERAKYQSLKKIAGRRYPLYRERRSVEPGL